MAVINEYYAMCGAWNDDLAAELAVAGIKVDPAPCFRCGAKLITGPSTREQIAAGFRIVCRTCAHAQATEPGTVAVFMGRPPAHNAELRKLERSRAERN